MPRLFSLCAPLFVLSLAACPSKPSSDQPKQAVTPKTEAISNTPSAREPSKAPASKYGLALALAQFSGATPKPARFELLTPQAGEFKVEGVDDSDSNVFHKVMPLALKDGKTGLVTLGGTKAAVKLYTRGASGFSAETLWSEAFGGKFDRMRDAEIQDLDGDGAPDIAVGTHDQGVVAYLHQGKDGKWLVERLDKQPDTFIHEIEIGDLDGDGVPEIYATPSEPNRLEAGAQSGQVVSYVPKLKQGRKVVADLKNRHAKEILVTDMEGDGRPELYVAVEALTKGQRDSVEIVEPVEIRRYDHNTPKDAGKVVARIRDRYCRFLTAGDVDGDGKKELVAAAFRSGVWLLRPGAKGAEWSVENIETQSSGFEHAALLTDLDGDGRDELYVAADDQGELRRYVWKDGKPVRDTILRRENPRETWTWNITRVPASVLSP
jgi:FG-GAP-like repeat